MILYAIVYVYDLLHGLYLYNAPHEIIHEIIHIYMYFYYMHHDFNLTY